MKWLTRKPTAATSRPAAPPPAPVAKRSDEQLEAVLMDLQKYGKLRLGVYGDEGGWHCHVELLVSSKGFSADVRSGWDHAVPLDAALECRDRLHAQLKSLGSL